MPKTSAGPELVLLKLGLSENLERESSKTNTNLLSKFLKEV